MEIADFLNEVYRLLDMPVKDRVETNRELLTHYREVVDDLIASGMADAAAREEAVTSARIAIGDRRAVQCDSQLRPVESGTARGCAVRCIGGCAGGAVRRRVLGRPVPHNRRCPRHNAHRKCS